MVNISYRWSAPFMSSPKQSGDTIGKFFSLFLWIYTQANEGSIILMSRSNCGKFPKDPKYWTSVCCVDVYSVILPYSVITWPVYMCMLGLLINTASRSYHINTPTHGLRLLQKRVHGCCSYGLSRVVDTSKSAMASL